MSERDPSKAAVDAALEALYPGQRFKESEIPWPGLRPDLWEKVRRVALVLDDFVAQAVKERREDHKARSNPNHKHWCLACEDELREVRRG